MTSFQDGEKTYLLQTNGNLWLAQNDPSLTARLIFFKKIMGLQRELLRGALIYRGKLFLYGKLLRGDPFGKVLPELADVYQVCADMGEKRKPNNSPDCPVKENPDRSKGLFLDQGVNKELGQWSHGKTPG
ncbi:hypothetical protein Btru_073989 [Bulinus truncatus]|nr:hypothetical protein Btru_073989 [Bulinus truncatus]